MFKWIGIGVAVITLLLIGYIVVAFLFPDFREASRDIAIVLLAALQLISSILVIALLFAVLYAVNQINKLAQGNVVPKIDLAMKKLDEVLENTRLITGDVRESTSTAINTTTFVAERVASPVIRLASLVSGVRAAATTLARGGGPEQEG